MMEMGLDAHLRCVTVGRHSTTWLGPDEEPLADTDKYKILPDGSLIIKSLTFDDMGVYQCLVKNSFGHDLAETFVYPVAVSTECPGELCFWLNTSQLIHQIEQIIQNQLYFLLISKLSSLSIIFDIELILRFLI